MLPRLAPRSAARSIRVWQAGAAWARWSRPRWWRALRLLATSASRCAADVDLRATIVTALMGREQIGAVENAHPPGVGAYRERAAHVGMWDRVVVQIEADIRL